MGHPRTRNLRRWARRAGLLLPLLLLGNLEQRQSYCFRPYISMAPHGPGFILAHDDGAASLSLLPTEFVL